MKKTARKVLLMACSALLLVCLTVSATVAYLTAEDKVENTFTVGKVAIKLDEADVNTDGTYVEDHDTRTEANEYHLLPGHTYIKDPTVTVLKGSEASYIRMLVTINEQADLDAIFAKNGGAALTTFFGGVSTDWTLVAETENDDDTRTYEFRYKSTVAAPDGDVVLDDLFETVIIPGEIENDELLTISDLTITVVAQAIQADGFENADEAWSKF